MYLLGATTTLLALIVTVSSYDYGQPVETQPVVTSGGGYGGSRVVDTGYGGGSRVVDTGYGGGSRVVEPSYPRPSRVNTGYSGRQRGYGSGGIHGSAPVMTGYGYGPEVGFFESGYGAPRQRSGYGSNQRRGYGSNRQSRPSYDRSKVVESGYGESGPVIAPPTPAPVVVNPYAPPPKINPIVEESGYGEPARSQEPLIAPVVVPPSRPIAPIRKPINDQVEILNNGYGAYSSGGYGSSGEVAEAGW